MTSATLPFGDDRASVIFLRCIIWHHVSVINIKKSHLGNVFGTAARQLGQKWNIHKSNARDSPGGGMITLGVSKGDDYAEHLIHGPTKKDKKNTKRGWWMGINQDHRTLNTAACELSKIYSPERMRPSGIWQGLWN